MQSIRYLNGILTVLALLLGLHVWTLWTTGAPVQPPAAHAQGIPDSGAQRQEIIDQLKLLNSKTAKLQELMVSGKVRVQVVQPPEENAR